VSKILLDAGPSEKGWSTWATANCCLQLYALRHKLGEEGRSYMEDSGPALVRGAIGHVGIAHHYARLDARRKGEDPEQYYDTESAVRIAAGSWGTDGNVWIDPILETLDDYFIRYGHEDRNGGQVDDGLELLGVETQLKGWVTHPGVNALGEPIRYRYTQRGDLFVRDNYGILDPGPGGSKGKICYLDHKYIGFLNHDTINRYALDGQFLGYTWFGRRRHGDDFGGAFLNLIEVGGRGGSRSAKKRFRRVPVPPAPEALSEFPQSIVDAGNRIAQLEAEGRDPWKWPRRISAGNCWTLWGPCPAHNYCRFGRTCRAGRA